MQLTAGFERASRAASLMRRLQLIPVLGGQGITMWLPAMAIRIGLLTCLLAPSAAARDHKLWTWSKTLPDRIGDVAAKAKPTTRDVNAVFAKLAGPAEAPRLETVLAALGRPAGFSRQSMYSLASGSDKPSRDGGTFRFLLAEGGELQVWTPDFVHVGLAMRWDSRGEPKLLFK